MIITAKRKLTSSVAILCAIMILIGIFPLNLFTVRKAEAASDAKYQSGYIYFDISNIVNSDDVTNKGDWSTIYMLYHESSWGASPAFTKITDTMYGIDVSGWNNTDASGEIVFATVNDWKLVNSDYQRTSLSGYNVAGAKGRVFSWNGSSTETIDGHPAFVLTSKEAPIGEYIEKQSLAGKTINFKDMTGELNSNITATFTGAEVTETSLSLTNNQITIPNDINGKPYTTVEFKNGNTSLGKYNLFNESSSGATPISYDENTCNTFYYGATEKSDNTKVSYWGAKAQSGTVSAKLYLDSDSFPTGGTAPTIQFNSTSAAFSVGSDEDAYSYSISSVQTNDIITVTYNGNKYHFFWSDTSKDMVTISNDIANVSLTYGSSNTIYFDATLSKLSYAGSTTYDATMPMSGDDIYCYLYKNSTTNVKHKMTKLDPVTKGSNTWSDVYYYTLSDEDIAAGYTNIIFFSSSGGGWPDSYQYSASQTKDLTLPKNTNKTCFYADSSDNCIYTGTSSSANTKRSGYWDKPFTIRDAESGKNSTVVDIKASSFSSEKNNYGSTEVNYVNSTFYDYYTDFELNGSNRDDYNGESGLEKGASHRNWVNFRQFDQALSDYYKNKGVSVNDAIYTGHFQPTYDDWGYPFSGIAGTMGLYGWSNYNTFISNNNSNVNSDGTVITGNDGYYMYATQGIVNNKLDDGVLKTHDGEAASPYFDEDFLNGNNSKNTKLGKVYNNVAFPFTKKDVFGEGVDYWWYDSASKTLAMQKDTESDNYYLADHSLDNDRNWSKNLNSNGIYDGGDGVSNTYGLFPFNYGDNSAKNNNGSTYNYGYGAKLEFKFRLTDDGKVLNSNREPVDIKFLFSGDDDVWVYIDGKLALDVGGDHGQVTGMLDFANKKAYVSKVKKSANNPTNVSGSNKLASITYHADGESGNVEKTYDFYQQKDFNLEGGNSAEHTLTMYYMERGMWESNMKVAFNFPDSSELEVEKTVDKSDVNTMFSNLFDENENFEFLIQNRVTHFGTKDADGSTGLTTLNFAENLTGNLSVTSEGNIFEKMNSYNGQNNVVHWFANYSNENNEYTQARLGNLSADDKLLKNISEMTYLNFKAYIADDIASLNNMYIQLTDVNGRKLYGFLDANKVKDTVLSSNAWSKVTVILDELTAESGFDKANISTISFQYNIECDVYLDDFIFKNDATSIGTGFTTAQENIPDYGSATSGKLENTKNAQYYKKDSSASSSKGTLNLVDESGNFYLKNKQLVTFYDQFRRGSYISLRENLSASQKKLYTTTYTVYEDGSAVTSMATGNTVTNSSISNLKNVTGTAVNDGRTEEPDSQSGLANYTGTKPDADTLVFRSYTKPDGTNQSTKLKVQFNNKVNVGSIKITKAKVGNNVNLTGKYSFYVEFKNVGGSGLEGANSIVSNVIELGVGESKTITGIPVGTEYIIHEVDENSDGAVLKTVTTGGNDVLISQNTVNGTATHSVTGTVDDANTEYSYTFYNTKTATIDLKIIKNWLEVDSADRGKYIPTANAVSFCLLRSTDGSNWESVPNYNSFTLDSDWEKTITKLELFNDDNGQQWEYSIRELDKNGKPIANGDTTTITAASGNVTYKVEYTTSTSSNIITGLIVNNTRIVQNISMPETGGEGGEPFNFVLFGAIAIALAGGILLLNKKYAFLHIGKSSKEVR